VKLDGEYQFPCGCWATSGGPYWGYECDCHTCDGTVLASERQERREQKIKSARASYKRGTAPYYTPQQGFSLLRK
jgi:hypothetical protein